MGGILQVDTIKNNNASTIITQTNTTTLTFGSSGQTIVIPSGTTFNASSASVNLPSINLATGVTGTLPFANGGTGLATLGTAGQALVVNSGATALQYSTVGATAGQVIQVVTATDQTQRSTTSQSFVTGSNTLTATITPSSSSNKILVLVSTNGNGSTANMYLTVYRGSTNIGNSSTGLMSASQDMTFNASCVVYDSPATTSSTTYQVYFRLNSSSGICFINADPVKSSITLLEVKG